jgi:hypothetical protein
MSHTSSPNARFVLCVRNDDYVASLDVRKLCLAVADKSVRAANLLRVIDESGEDYLYPVDDFVSCPLPRGVREALLRRIRRVRRRPTQAAASPRHE